MQIKNLTIKMKQDLRTILEDFTFVLAEGDKTAVIGEEGNGKSTLLKLIYNPSLVEPYIEYTGEIITQGKSIGYLPQELPEASKHQPLYHYFSEIPGFYDATGGDLAIIAKQLGLSVECFYDNRLLSEFSGGEKVKLQLAGLLLQKPDILLLDEPSNDLDIQTLEWLESFLNNTKIPLLYISHDETLLKNTANRIIHLEQLRRKTTPRHTIVRSDYESYVKQREHLFLKQNRIAQSEHTEHEKQIQRWNEIYQKVHRDLNSISRQDPFGARLLKKKMKAVKSLEKRLDKEKETLTPFPETETAVQLFFDKSIDIPKGKTVIETQIVDLKAGETVLIERAFLSVKGGEHICFVGKNGSGKTTLLKHLYELLKHRTDISVAYMPQDYSELLDKDKTPIEFLMREATKDEKTYVSTLLGSMKYTQDEMHHPLDALSGGQKAKLLIAKMILDKNNVLLLDEPTRNFSPLSSPVIRDVLKTFGGTIISVSHDRLYLSEVCSKLYKLENKTLIPYHTNPDSFL